MSANQRMSPFISISAAEELEEFLRTVGGLHDAIVREVGIVSRSHVSETRQMIAHGAPFDARVVFQSQSQASPVIELLLEGMTTLRVSGRSDLGDAEAEFAAGGIVIFPAGRENTDDWLMEAEGMRYRILESSRLGDRMLAVADHPLFGRAGGPT